MDTHLFPGRAPKTALVVIPKTVNYFNNVAGRRLGEALTHLGTAVDIHSLQTCPDREYEWCFFMNLVELAASCKDRAYAMRRIARIKGRCGATAVWLLEPVESVWFADGFKAFQEAGLDVLIDTTFHDQADLLAPEARPYYRSVFYGLTESEVQAVRTAIPPDRGRDLPWVLVGHMTTRRVKLVERLIKEFTPGGVCTSPTWSP